MLPSRSLSLTNLSTLVLFHPLLILPYETQIILPLIYSCIWRITVGFITGTLCCTSKTPWLTDSSHKKQPTFLYILSPPPSPSECLLILGDPVQVLTTYENILDLLRQSSCFFVFFCFVCFPLRGIWAFFFSPQNKLYFHAIIFSGSCFPCFFR